MVAYIRAGVRVRCVKVSEFSLLLRVRRLLNNQVFLKACIGGWLNMGREHWSRSIPGQPASSSSEPNIWQPKGPAYCIVWSIGPDIYICTSIYLHQYIFHQYIGPNVFASGPTYGNPGASPFALYGVDGAITFKPGT